MQREELVKNIKKICAYKGVSIRDMEQALEFSPGLISRWTRMSPSVEKVIKVAEFLGVSLNALVSGQTEENRNDFVERLCEKTREGKLEWFLCGSENPFSFPVNELKEMQDGKNVCCYCRYRDGFFLLASAVNGEEEIEDICLYLLPNRQQKPVRYEIDGDELLPLYDIVRTHLVWEEDREGADALLDAFMKDDTL